MIVWWQTRSPDVPVLLSKKDVVADAFKWLPVRGSDTRLFAAGLAAVISFVITLTGS